MKISALFTLIGLASATESTLPRGMELICYPQEHHRHHHPWRREYDPELERLIKQDVAANVQKTYDLLREKNKFSAAGAGEIARLFGWVVGGSLPGDALVIKEVPITLGQISTVAGTVYETKHTMSREALKQWVRDFGVATMGFLPEVGVLGNLPGFMMLLVTIAQTMEKHLFADVIAEREQEMACFETNGRTYKGLCDNCDPNLMLSLLGKLHGCSDEPVAPRDHATEYNKAKGFCYDAVLCRTYAGGGTGEIIKKGYRLDPLRSFWCKDRQTQIGLLLQDRIGSTLRNNLDVIDFQEFRQALETPCMELLDDRRPSNCPSKEAIERANADWPPVEYCQPGLTPASD